MANLSTTRVLQLGAAGGLLWWLYQRLMWKDVSETEAQTMSTSSEEQLIAGLDPRLQPIARKFLADARAAGHKILLTQGRRTIAEQNALYAKGRTAPGSKVTNSKGGDSPHNYGLAIDFAFLDEKGRAVWPEKGPWAAVAAFGKALGLTWGGDWKKFVDRPHLELSEPFKVARADWKAGKLQVA